MLTRNLLRRRGRPLRLLLVLAPVAAIVLLTPVTPLSRSDARPAGIDWVADFETGDYSQWDGIQTGRTYRPDGSFVIAKTPKQQMPLVTDVVRQGRYAAKLVVEPGDHAYAPDVEAAAALEDTGMTQGSDAYYGMSMRFPADWQGSRNFGTIWEFLPTQAPRFPSYGVLSLDAHTPNSLELVFHTGKTPDPGSSYFTPEFNVVQTILSPVPKDTWLDFVFHLRLSAYSGGNAGIFTMWYRKAGTQAWTKLYDDTGARDAVVNRPPHPTWMRNSNGVPSAEFELGFYSKNTPWTRTLWFDNVVRGTSFDAVASTFDGSAAAAPPPTTPPPTTAAPTTPPPTTPPPTTAPEAPSTTPTVPSAQSTPSTVPAAPSTAPTPAAGPPAAPENLVTDGDFESDPGGSFYNVGPASFAWAQDAAHSGTHALRIVSAVQALSRWLSRTDEVRTVPGAVYSGSTWLRTAKLLGQATVALTFWSADDRFLGAVESAPAPANGDWAQATVSGTAPAGAVSVRLEIRLSGSGTLWADDAAVTASGA